MPMINLANYLPCTEAEGPGRRAALWVQGCLKRCVDCCNQAYLEIVPRQLVSSETVLDWISEARSVHEIEGVTFLGGEPFLQAEGLRTIAAGVRAMGLSVMVFSGYTLAELESLPFRGIQALMAQVDVLVDGPFLPELLERERNWVGSTNQRFHYLTERYDSTIETNPAFSHSLEVRVGSGGTLRINGWPMSVS